MLLQLIRKEILQHLMSLRFAIACVLCLVVILCSIFVRSRDYSQLLDDYGQESAMAREQLDDVGHPWAFAMQVYSRPNPMKILVRGVTDANGGSVRVSPGDPLEPDFPQPDNPAATLFPSIDLVTFVGVIMSLLALVFGYDAVCGEKQQGTLRLMLSYSVPRHLVLVSKWIGAYVTLILPFLLTVLVGIVLVMTRPDVSLTSGQWARLSGIVAMALVYVAAVLSMAIYVSCLTRRSATCVMLLLSLWAVLVLVIPNLSPHLARMLRPTPGALGVEDQRIAKERDIRQGVRRKISTWREKNNTETDRMKRQYEQRKFSVRAYGEGWVDTLNAWEKIDEPRRRRMDAQVRLSRWIGRASPFTCFAMAATELADAGVMHESRLRQQLRDFQVELTEYGTDEYVALLDKELAAGGNRVDWRHNRQNPFPVFGYSPAAGWDYWKAVSLDAGILAAMTVVLFLLSHVAFLRYDVR